MDLPWRPFIAWIAPPRCGICGCPCRAIEPLCRGCTAALARERGGAGALAGVATLCWAASYQGAARRLVSALKFGGRTALVRIAAQAMAAALREFAPHALHSAQSGSLRLVPVPPAGRRARRRGFDPAELIATELGRALGLPVASPLARADAGRQVGRPRAARLAAPPRIRAAGAVPGRVVIVDDVATTGATLRACAAALRAAGAEPVAAAVFARAL